MKVIKTPLVLVCICMLCCSEQNRLAYQPEIKLTKNDLKLKGDIVKYFSARTVRDWGYLTDAQITEFDSLGRIKMQFELDPLFNKQGIIKYFYNKQNQIKAIVDSSFSGQCEKKLYDYRRGRIVKVTRQFNEYDKKSYTLKDSRHYTTKIVYRSNKIMEISIDRDGEEELERTFYYNDRKQLKSEVEDDDSIVFVYSLNKLAQKQIYDLEENNRLRKSYDINENGGIAAVYYYNEFGLVENCIETLYDENGNEIEVNFYDEESDKSVDKYSFINYYDSIGNWTFRKQSILQDTIYYVRSFQYYWDETSNIIDRYKRYSIEKYQEYRDYYNEREREANQRDEQINFIIDGIKKAIENYQLGFHTKAKENLLAVTQIFEEKYSNIALNEHFKAGYPNLLGSIASAYSLLGWIAMTEDSLWNSLIFLNKSIQYCDTSWSDAITGKKDFGQLIQNKYYRGLVYLDLSYYDEAYQDGLDIIKMDKNCAYGYYISGLAKIHEGKRYEGCRLLQNASNLNFDLADKEIRKYCKTW